MKKPLGILLREMIKAAAEGVITAQVQLSNAMLAGAIKMADDHEEIFEMISANPQSGQAASIFFTDDDLVAIFVPKENSGIVVPKKSGIITGRH